MTLLMAFDYTGSFVKPVDATVCVHYERRVGAGYRNYDMGHYNNDHARMYRIWGRGSRANISYL